MDFSQFLKFLSEGNKNVLAAFLVQFPVVATFLYLCSATFRSVGYVEQLIFTSAACVLLTFASYILFSFCGYIFQLTRELTSAFVLASPTLVAFSIFYIMEFERSLGSGGFVFLISFVLMLAIFIIVFFMRKHVYDEMREYERREKEAAKSHEKVL